MVNQQLLEYVRAQRVAGLSKEAIIKAAAVGGWTPADMEEIFMTLDGVAKPVPPPTPPPPTPVQPRVITPPPQTIPAPASIPVPQPVAPLTPLTPRPMAAPSEVTTAPTQARKGTTGLYITIGVVILVLALVVAGYLFVWPVISEMIAATKPTPGQTIDTLPPPPQLINDGTTPEDTSVSATASTTASEDTTATTTATTSAQ